MISFNLVGSTAPCCIPLTSACLSGPQLVTSPEGLHVDLQHLGLGLELGGDDGLDDLVVQFRKGEIGLTCGDTSLTLTGRNADGVYIQGVDAIRTTPPG